MSLRPPSPLFAVLFFALLAGCGGPKGSPELGDTSRPPTVSTSPAPSPGAMPSAQPVEDLPRDWDVRQSVARPELMTKLSEEQLVRLSSSLALGATFPEVKAVLSNLPEPKLSVARQLGFVLGGSSAEGVFKGLEVTGAVTDLFSRRCELYLYFASGRLYGYEMSLIGLEKDSVKGLFMKVKDLLEAGHGTGVERTENDVHETTVIREWRSPQVNVRLTAETYEYKPAQVRWSVFTNPGVPGMEPI